jgi:trans-2,3-dihydro-3-hydroxyanthranilate isomerase
MTTFRYNTLNVFTDTERGGNPLAVFVQAEGLSDGQMGRIASDLNLSETVFVLRAREGGHARVRIFTPTSELTFAGHPLVGAAWILGSHLVIPHMRLETAAGPIEVELERSGDALYRAYLRGPRAEVLDLACDWIPSALGLPESASPVSEVAVYRCGMTHCLVNVGSRANLAALRPDLGRLGQWTVGGVLAFTMEHGVAIRYFAPSFGVPEDPATGSAALALGQYLADKGHWNGSDKLELSQTTRLGRTSELSLISRSEGSDGANSIWVGGGAILTGRGERIVRG